MGSGITSTGGNGHARTHTTSGDYSIRQPTEAYCQPKAPRARASTAPNSTARRYQLTLHFYSILLVLLCTALYRSVPLCTALYRSVPLCTTLYRSVVPLSTTVPSVPLCTIWKSAEPDHSRQQARASSFAPSLCYMVVEGGTGKCACR
jgi:hypothetical protein